MVRDEVIVYAAVGRGTSVCVLTSVTVDVVIIGELIGSQYGSTRLERRVTLQGPTAQLVESGSRADAPTCARADAGGGLLTPLVESGFAEKPRLLLLLLLHHHCCHRFASPERYLAPETEPSG